MKKYFINKKSGKIYDNCIITIDKNIIVNNNNYFDFENESDINIIFDLIQKKAKKTSGNLCFYFYYWKDNTSGIFERITFPYWDDKEKFKNFIKENFTFEYV